MSALVIALFAGAFFAAVYTIVSTIADARWSAR